MTVRVAFFALALFPLCALAADRLVVAPGKSVTVVNAAVVTPATAWSRC